MIQDTPALYRLPGRNIQSQAPMSAPPGRVKQMRSAAIAHHDALAGTLGSAAGSVSNRRKVR
jgi:hypothetical protein